jgi:hypothetical protein
MPRRRRSGAWWIAVSVTVGLAFSLVHGAAMAGTLQEDHDEGGHKASPSRPPTKGGAQGKDDAAGKKGKGTPDGGQTISVTLGRPGGAGRR